MKQVLSFWTAQKWRPQSSGYYLFSNFKDPTFKWGYYRVETNKWSAVFEEFKDVHEHLKKHPLGIYKQSDFDAQWCWAAVPYEWYSELTAVHTESYGWKDIYVAARNEASFYVWTEIEGKWCINAPDKPSMKASGILEELDVVHTSYAGIKWTEILDHVSWLYFFQALQKKYNYNNPNSPVINWNIPKHHFDWTLKDGKLEKHEKPKKEELTTDYLEEVLLKEHAMVTQMKAQAKQPKPKKTKTTNPWYIPPVTGHVIKNHDWISLEPLIVADTSDNYNEADF